MTLQDYQTIVTRVLGHFKVRPDSLKVKVKDVNGGRMLGNHITGFKITLPKWLEVYDRWYAVYYTIHEACHIIDYMLDGGYEYHSETFKRIENEALALYGIRIVRRKVYPKELYVNSRRVYNILKH